MKIAQIVCTFPPYTGGIGNVAFHFSKKLTALGHKITVFTPEYNIYSTNKNNVFSKYGFKTVRLPHWLQYGNAACLKGLYSALNGFDWVHLHTPFFGTSEMVWLKLFNQKTPKLAITYHMEFIADSWFKKMMSIPTDVIQHSLYRRANFITVSSFDYIRHCSDNFLYTKHKDKLYEIPFAPDIPLLKTPPNQDVLTQYNLSLKDKIVLFVGSLDKAHYFKGLDILLKAMSLLKTSACLLVIGKGDLKDKYQQTAQNLGIGNKVIFTDYVSNKTLAKYYNLSDVVVLPSVNRGEAFGLVLVEAMSTGTPVIASDLPGVRTVVDNGKNGILVKPNDSPKLACAMDRLLTQKSLHERMSRNAYQKATKKYNWNKIVAQLDFIYKKYENCFNK